MPNARSRCVRTVLARSTILATSCDHGTALMIAIRAIETALRLESSYLRRTTLWRGATRRDED